ncbi:MAG: PTS sugar transporter subunit IIA [Gammaproteobacteria bacterium]|nr:PTS sugar transporter subunit IIA [Gammaproteobacteria bacterium]
MELSDLLRVEQIEFGFEATSKKRTLERVSELLANRTDNASAIAIAEGFFARERLGSTGLGFGVALPHTRLTETTIPAAAFLRLANPIDFDAPDREPVTVVVGLVVPEQATDAHLQVLAHLASRFHDPVVREKLRSSDSAIDVRALLIEQGN